VKNWSGNAGLSNFRCRASRGSTWILALAILTFLFSYIALLPIVSVKVCDTNLIPLLKSSCCKSVIVFVKFLWNVTTKLGRNLAIRSLSKGRERQREFLAARQQQRSPALATVVDQSRTRDRVPNVVSKFVFGCVAIGRTRLVPWRPQQLPERFSREKSKSGWPTPYLKVATTLLVTSVCNNEPISACPLTFIKNSLPWAIYAGKIRWI